MKRFTKVLESLEQRVEIDPELEELQNDLIEILDNSINTDDTDLKIETMESYIEDKETSIVGLINDSDIFDFYLKHRNELDLLLTDTNHFEVSPSELGVNTSVYEYLIESTKVAIQECFKKMINKNEKI
jgi:hypothetical protein